MKENNIEFSYPDNSFYFSYREVYGHFNMLSHHFHNTFEVYYLLSGERYYFIKDRVFHIKPGNLVLINENDLHKTTDADTKDHTRILLNFSRDYLMSNSKTNIILKDLFTHNINVIPLLPTDQQHVEALLYRMNHEIQQKAIGYEVSLQSLLLELLVYTRRTIKEDNINGLDHPSPMHEKISEIVQFINRNYSNPLTLLSISKQFYVSQYYLSRAFKQVTGFTFIEYLNSVRIREAQLLLRQSNEKVINIGEKVGFQNNSHFGRVFKEITNLSPLQYRKLNK